MFTTLFLQTSYPGLKGPNSWTSEIKPLSSWIFRNKSFYCKPNSKTKGPNPLSNTNDLVKCLTNRLATDNKRSQSTCHSQMSTWTCGRSGPTHPPTSINCFQLCSLLLSSKKSNESCILSLEKVIGCLISLFYKIS